MLHRGWFRLRYLSLSLILSCTTVFTGDGTVSLIKSVGSWAFKTVGKVAGAALVGYGAGQYNSDNFDPSTGTFGIPSAVSDNPGLPVGLQTPPIQQTASEISEQREYERMPREQQQAFANKQWEQMSKDFTQRELDQWIRREDDLVKNAQTEAAYRKRKGQMDQASDNESRAKEYSQTKEILEKEKADRQPKPGLVKQLSDGSLKKLLRNTKEELEYTKKELSTETSRYWFNQNEQKIADNNQIKSNLEVTIKQIEREQQGRTKKTVTHVVSTAMVMTSKTAGTDNKTTKAEKVPEKGKELPVYEPEIVDKVPAVRKYDLVGGGNGPDKDPEDERIKKIVTTATVGVAVEEAVRHTLTPTQPANNSQQALREHEAKQFDVNQKQMKEARKAELAKMNNDQQPFHEKGIEAKFPDKPGQKDHQWEDRTGHIKERTPTAEKAVKETIKGEYFETVDKHGNSSYFRELPDGKQVWVKVRPDGTIQNCGANETPWPKNPVTGRYERPAGLSKKGPGVSLGIGAGVGSSLLSSESKASESAQLSPETIAKIKSESFNPLVADKIRKSENPFTLPAAPKNSISLVSQSPEMKALVDRRTEQLSHMTSKELMEEIMKPLQSMPGFKSTTTPSVKMPTFALPSSTSTPSKIGQTTPSVLSSTLTGKVSAPSSKSPSSSKPSSYSAPKSSSSSSSSSKSSSNSSGFKTSSGWSGSRSSSASGFKTSSGYSGGGSGSGSGFKTSSGYSGKRN